MNERKKSGSPQSSGALASPSLGTVLDRLSSSSALSETRLRDLRSAVKRVAELLGNVPGAIPLNMEEIQAGLSSVNPIAVGMTAKRLTNIRSDFVAAVKASGAISVEATTTRKLSASWDDLFARLAKPRAHLGLTRLARYASEHGIEPEEVNDAVITNLMAAVKKRSLHQKPRVLHRQIAIIWNEAATSLGLQAVTVPDYRGPPKRIDESLLPPSFLQDRDSYLSWCAVTDPFAVDARQRPLAPRTVKLARDQIHAAVSALVKSGVKPESIRSLADLVAVENLKSILRQRLADAAGEERSFNHYLAKALVRMAREWVKVDAAVLTKLRGIASKLRAPKRDLTTKNKRFLRQFDDPQTLRRLRALPEQLWKEVKAETNRKPNFRVLAKAQAAIGIGLPTYMPVRPENLWELEFDKHLFMRSEPGAKSTLELDSSEVKNDREIGFDIPPHLTKMLLEYRDRIAPMHLGCRPKRLFVNIDGTPKSQGTVSYLIQTYAKKRAGIDLTPHQFRHLAAKNILDANPGNFLGLKELLGHKNIKTTMIYAGINTRRAGQHHYELIEKAVARQMPQPKRRKKTDVR